LTKGCPEQSDPDVPAAPWLLEIPSVFPLESQAAVAAKTATVARMQAILIEHGLFIVPCPRSPHSPGHGLAWTGALTTPQSITTAMLFFCHHDPGVDLVSSVRLPHPCVACFRS
jgi:hypothetical protein